MLLKHLPKLSGTGMDLCCGYGLLSHHILKTNPAIKQIHLLDADARAVQCAAQNISHYPQKSSLHWLDAANETLPGNLDWIVCNPPFHTAHKRDTTLGQAIVEQACQSLRRGGTLYLVANRQLPYEQILHHTLKQYQTLEERGGFKVIKGTRL